MRIGIPKEIKNHEYRVSISPAGVQELVAHGHEVFVETQAGYAIGYDDKHYQTAGAKIAKDAKGLFDSAELIVKVKEPQESECDLLTKDHTLFSYLHLAAEPEMTKKLLASGCTGIAFETITAADGTLPLLAPMSEVAGRMAIQAGAHSLEKAKGGAGVLLSGVPGVSPANVTIVGGGVVGTSAALIAVGMGAKVTILDKSLPRLRKLEEQFGFRVNLIYSTEKTLEEYVTGADLVVGAILIPGASAPKLITEAMIKKMRRGSVLVDVAIDQGGCAETSRPTSHAEPTYIEHDVVHYCVTNIPGAVAKTSSKSLENAILPYTIALANKGIENVLKEDEHMRAGVNIYQGNICYEAIANDLGLDYVALAELL